MTANEFLATYRGELIARYPWAQDKDKLDRFMSSARMTVAGDLSTWDHKGEAVNIAWRAIGGKGKPTLKALRALARETP